MRKEQAGESVELPQQANRKYLEHKHCEIVRDVYNTLQTSGLDKFIFSLIDSVHNDLNAVLPHLDRLPEATFKELIQVIDGLAEARNELRLARFLFDAEEINPIYRLILRNKAILRSKDILHKVIRVWPYYNHAHE